MIIITHFKSSSTTVIISLIYFFVVSGHEELIDVAGCDLVVVKINKCQGYCTSFSFFHPINNNKLTMLAKCCRMTEVKKVTVNLTCKDGEENKEITIPSASQCSCFDCGVDTE